MKPDVGADQFKETNKARDTSRLACDKNSIFVFHTGVPSPRGSVQIAYKCPTLLAPDLTVINSEFLIFYLARSFGGLIKPNCGTNVPK